MESTKFSLVQSYFVFYCAQEVLGKMHAVFKKKCFGCQNGCLSQLSHACVTLSEEQLLELYMDDVLSTVDYDVVLANCYKSFFCSEHFSIFVDIFYQTVIKCLFVSNTNVVHWKTKMQRLTVKLILLNRRLF